MVQTGTDSACTRVRPDDGGDWAMTPIMRRRLAVAFRLSDESWTAPFSTLQLRGLM